MHVFSFRRLVSAAALLLVGCASPRTAMQDNILRVAVCPDYPPIVFKTTGVIVGVEADLAVAISSAVHARVEFVEMPFDKIIPSIEDHSCDIAMSGMSDSEFRHGRVRFVAPYMSIGQMALVRAVDAPRFASPEHLYHVLSVGVLKGTTGERFVSTHISNAVVTVFSDPAEAIKALKDKRIHAFVDDAPFVLQAQKDNPDLAPLNWLLTDEHLAWAMSTDKAYDPTYNLLCSLVEQMRRTGELRGVINRYFDISVKVK